MACSIITSMNFLPGQNFWSFVRIQTKREDLLESLSHTLTELYVVSLKTEDTVQACNFRKRRCSAFTGETLKKIYFRKRLLTCSVSICTERKWTKSLNTCIRFKNNRQPAVTLSRSLLMFWETRHEPPGLPRCAGYWIVSTPVRTRLLRGMLVTDLISKTSRIFSVGLFWQEIKLKIPILFLSWFKRLYHTKPRIPHVIQTPCESVNRPH